MKEQILKLRKEGKTYKQIKEILGCSKGTISFHCGEGQKEKSRKRSEKIRNIKNNIPNKVCNFIKGAARHKTDRFQKRKGNIYSGEKTFTWNDVIKKFGEETICYLTGEKINLLLDKNYQFDHIIPKTRGGSSTIDNLGILHSTVNQMKGNLLNEELYEWCKKILEFKGYKIIQYVGSTGDGTSLGS